MSSEGAEKESRWWLERKRGPRRPRARQVTCGGHQWSPPSRAAGRHGSKLMPRILPRLLKALENVPLAPNPKAKFAVPSTWTKRKRSLWRKPPVIDWTGRGRGHSILADEAKPFADKRVLLRHKRLPPLLTLHTAKANPNLGHDLPREMTEEEREWHASPYCTSILAVLGNQSDGLPLRLVRMLGGPLRRCVITGRGLPTGEPCLHSSQPSHTQLAPSQTS